MLEVDLPTELHEPWVDDLVRESPPAAERTVDVTDGAGVHHVVRVEIDLEPEPVVVDDLAYPEVEPRDPVASSMRLQKCCGKTTRTTNRVATELGLRALPRM